MEEVIYVVVDGRVLEEFHEVGIDGTCGISQRLVFGIDQGVGIFIVERGIPKEELNVLYMWFIRGIVLFYMIEGEWLVVQLLMLLYKNCATALSLIPCPRNRGLA